ncbi:hypothetical protein G6F46_010916 [Rhizopus delemar]|uniref:Uncharacterized protein n=3 Tax=Rhizopus TaxID=4842 RepID=I1BI79_RHIO9|nr:hypothetical protein RO3G_00613 [Rhizopus delemar RA 99-880]KAG1449328.1 hypothetical protein G6F55_010217 [Rhizopus delemar]KAG1536485.1 hypothetical protein G6F51_010947 [Rhizopus arrhizus]KAG1490576.1 hypothetical protein G6F54_010627 [Rhizopus delemar]KAG1503169.1 hypothetical protein G6F53_010691 [Rhizopus delemar]|eukprot:EIE75909.1 hypothetical protein RO3G_00613 [Rhizopus delemar RA 99-880]
MTNITFDVYKALNLVAIIGLLLNFVQNFFFGIWSPILNGVFKILSLIIMSPFVIGFVGSLLILVVGVIYLILHFVIPGKEPSHMSYTTYQSIVNDQPVIPVTNQPQQLEMPIPSQTQNYVTSQPSPLPSHQIIHDTANMTSYSHEQHVQSSPVYSHAVQNESKEKVEVA